MKYRITGYRSTRTAGSAGFSKGRRHVLLLGMALTGITLVRYILQIPPRTSSETFVDNRLSRHEASFYTTHGKQER